MKAVSIYQRNQRWQIWAAFGVAIIFHLAAIKLAGRQATSLPVENGPDGPVINITETPAAPADPVEPPVASPPPTERADLFHDENPPPPLPKRPVRATPPLVRSAKNGAPRSLALSAAKVMALQAPRLEYPYEARRQRLTGAGVAVLVIDPATGAVIDVLMKQSTGSAILDNAAVNGFRRWRFSRRIGRARADADHIYDDGRDVLMDLASPHFFPAVKVAGAMPEDFSAENFAELRRRFELPLLQFAARILDDRERARDVVQETFVEWQKRPGKRTEQTEASWLFTVCRNRALNICRKEKRMTYLDLAILEKQPDASLWPDEQLEKREAAGFLRQILEALPARQQEVLRLKFQNDLSYEEIGEITQLSANHVGVLIHNALKTLRQRYARDSREFVAFKTKTDL